MFISNTQSSKSNLVELSATPPEIRGRGLDKVSQLDLNPKNRQRAMKIA